jgi:hypothetical protein
LVDVDRLREWESYHILAWNGSLKFLERGGVKKATTLSVPRGWLV